MTDSLVSVTERFLAHRRALGRKYNSEQAELRLLVRFADEHRVNRLDQLTSAFLDEFLASRPRTRPRSFNHLLGVVACLMDWAVTQELLSASPLRTRRRRATSERMPFLFDAVQARRLLDATAALPDNSRAAQRGPTYRTIFALCYGLGLRAGEACGLHLGDVDVERNLLVVVGGKFGNYAEHAIMPSSLLPGLSGRAWGREAVGIIAGSRSGSLVVRSPEEDGHGDTCARPAGRAVGPVRGWF